MDQKDFMNSMKLEGLSDAVIDELVKEKITLERDIAYLFGFGTIWLTKEVQPLHGILKNQCRERSRRNPDRSKTKRIPDLLDSEKQDLITRMMRNDTYPNDLEKKAANTRKRELAQRT